MPVYNPTETPTATETIEATETPTETPDATGVLDAIRAGRTVAQDQDGVLYGAPALTLMLDPLGASNEPRPVRRLATLSALLVLLGLAGLVIWR